MCGCVRPDSAYNYHKLLHQSNRWHTEVNHWLLTQSVQTSSMLFSLMSYSTALLAVKSKQQQWQMNEKWMNKYGVLAEWHWGEKQSTWRKTCACVTLSTKSPTCPALESNPSCCCKRQWLTTSDMAKYVHEKLRCIVFTCVKCWSLILWTLIALPGITHGDQVTGPQGQKHTNWEAHHSDDIYFYLYRVLSFVFHWQLIKKNLIFRVRFHMTEHLW